MEHLSVARSAKILALSNNNNNNKSGPDISPKRNSPIMCDTGSLKVLALYAQYVCMPVKQGYFALTAICTIFKLHVMFSCFAQMEYGVAIVLAVIMDANKHQLVTELNVTAEMVIFYIPMEKHA